MPGRFTPLKEIISPDPAAITLQKISNFPPNKLFLILATSNFIVPSAINISSPFLRFLIINFSIGMVFSSSCVSAIFIISPFCRIILPSISPTRIFGPCKSCKIAIGRFKSFSNERIILIILKKSSCFP